MTFSRQVALKPERENATKQQIEARSPLRILTESPAAGLEAVIVRVILKRP
jgi:hypothetical protein